VRTSAISLHTSWSTRPRIRQASGGDRAVSFYRYRCFLYAALAVAAILGSPGVATGKISPFTTGFADDPLFQSSDPAVRSLWLDRAVKARAGIVRIGINWADVAPSARPAGFDPANPGDSAYRWEAVDAAVRDAAAHGLRILITTNKAPDWAEGADVPPDAHTGAWKPDPQEFGRFARALATRYSGRFPDPLHSGQTLPRVGSFEAWNEPNLDSFLAPQYQGGKLFMPGWYRTMLNRFYAGIKAARSGALVLAPATAPFGDLPGGERTPPVVFLRSLLCLQGGALRPTSCPPPAHFDVLSHHPIGLKPTQAALSPLDVSTPDMYKLKRVLVKAERTGRVHPRRPKPMWATEFRCDNNPPDPGGSPPLRQARWIEQTFFLLWKQGVRVAINLPIQDAPPVKQNYAYTLQSGIYFLDGEPKPSATAFRFPLVAHREGSGVLVWGIAPGPGVVHLQKETAAGWHTIASVQSQGTPHPFVMKLPISNGRRIVLRAQQRSNTSLPWVQWIGPCSSLIGECVKMRLDESTNQ
jgi:hypothetical protein